MSPEREQDSPFYLKHNALYTNEILLPTNEIVVRLYKLKHFLLRLECVDFNVMWRRQKCKKTQKTTKDYKKAVIFKIL